MFGPFFRSLPIFAILKFVDVNSKTLLYFGDDTCQKQQTACWFLLAGRLNLFVFLLSVLSRLTAAQHFYQTQNDIQSEKLLCTFLLDIIFLYNQSARLEFPRSFGIYNFVVEKCRKPFLIFHLVSSVQTDLESDFLHQEI